MKDFKLPLIAFVFSLNMHPALAKLESTQTFTKQMAIGESIELPASQRVWIQDAKVLKAKTQGARLQLVGLKEGDSLVKVGAQTWKIIVFEQTNFDKLPAIKKYIAQTAGLQMEARNGLLHIKGHLFGLKEWLGLIQVADGASFIMASQRNAHKQN